MTIEFGPEGVNCLGKLPFVIKIEVLVGHGLRWRLRLGFNLKDRSLKCTIHDSPQASLNDTKRRSYCPWRQALF